MATTTRTVAVGLFHDAEDARDAISALKDAGFRGEDIGLLMRDKGEARDMAEETGTHAGEGAATGLVAGGILGGLGGWLVGIGALAIPGVGPFIAAGALGAALGGAAIGAGVGAIAGALIGMGIPKEEAEYYEQEVRGGRTLVTVKAGSRMSEADAILHEHGAYDVEHRDGAAMGTTGTTAGTATAMTAGTTGEQTVRLREEELAPRKHMEQTGEVQVRKEVHTEHRTMDVPVTREEVVVDRRPVDRRPADSPDFRKEGETIRVPVREEQVTVEKTPVVKEEVTVGKRVVQDTQPVSAELRREEAVINREGDVDVRGWDQNRSRYQQRWQQRYGMTGGRWEDAEPAYSYGWQYRNDPRYRGRSWTEAEPELRRDWETRHADRPWDRSRDYIRDAWDDTTA